MGASRERDGPSPARLALRLSLYLLPGGAAAAFLWHDVVNPLLAGRPAGVPAWAAAATALLLAAAVVLLARDLRRLASGDGR